MTVPILTREHRWYCPECRLEDVTHETRPHSQMHQCPKLRGAWAPFAAAGTKAHLIVNERQDYVGADLVTTDPSGRVVMSVTTVREDGEDCAIFAPCAVAKLGDVL